MLEGTGNRAQGTRECSGFGVRRSASRIWSIFVLSFAFVSSLPADESAYAERLTALAEKCDELGLKEQAQVTRGWVIERHPRRQYLFLPAASDSTAPKAGAPEAARQWHKRFMELRRERAAELFAAAKAASDGGKADVAYQLLFEVLREDPDHAEARRVLGYVSSGSEWKLAGAEKATPRQPPYNHPQTGWRARGWWSLETPHFQIASNDQRELKEAEQQLERLDALWRQVFFRYWSTSAALAARFAGGNEPLAPERPKMQVVLFKTQQEYVTHVANNHPKAATTLGLYDDKQRVAYFFGGNKSVYPTWYHEGTHQLFQEAVQGTRDEPGQGRDFWALEGVALYMESLAEHAGYWTVGGWEADRMQFARYRVLSGDLKLPLAQISGLSREQIQKSEDIGRIYTQAAGLGHFFIDGEEGKYRAALVDLLAASYRGQETAGLLERATGQSLAKLDEQYRAFLNVTDDDLAGTPTPERMKNLSLCRTSVTEQGLARLAGCKNLIWLDLSLTAAGDEGLKSFAANTGLKQLFLEGTKVTAASLPLIANFKQLKQLDLSGLPIGDDDLKALAAARSLETLYLTGCPITDAGLEHLRGLKQLEDLDTGGTQVTAEGRKKLRVAIPKLKN
jgi:Leucine Rich repeat